MSLSLAILLIALVVATWTDVTRRKIFNWTTYTAMAACAAAHVLAEGAHGLTVAGLGGLICGGLLLVCYLGLDVGGGDVKLAALIGVGLGWTDGLYALLWTFAVAGLSAAALVVWRVGAWRVARSLWTRVRRRRGATLAGGDDPVVEQMRRPLFLAPAALVAVLIVAVPSLGWWS